MYRLSLDLRTSTIVISLHLFCEGSVSCIALDDSYRGQSMKMFRAVLVLALLTTLLPVSGLARNHTETWAGWVSDAACGAEHTKPGREDCVRKCKRGGASVGPPEWPAQPLGLVPESDKSVGKEENPQLPTRP